LQRGVARHSVEAQHEAEGSQCPQVDKLHALSVADRVSSVDHSKAFHWPTGPSKVQRHPIQLCLWKSTEYRRV
jgi:hypothetical protein